MKAEFLTPDEIEACTTWLLDNASPAVKYLTHRHILKANPDSEAMEGLWKGVQDSTEAKLIFSLQHEDGSWFSGGPWGPRGYRRQSGHGYTASRPKFVTTAWILPFLGEMGFTYRDRRIRKSCEYILTEVQYPDSLLDYTAQERNCCGLEAVPLRAFASVGMAADARLRGGWERLNLCQREDGGWLNPNHLPDSRTPSQTVGRWPWSRSCAWGSFFAVQALYYAKGQGFDAHLTAALEFMRWHLCQKDERHIQTWVYHGHNLVKELLMFSEAGFDLQAQPLQAVLEWLKAYYRPTEGMFRTQEKSIPNFVRHLSVVIKDFEQCHGPDYWETVAKTSPPVLRYHLYHLVEDDWLTYYLTRIAVNIARS